MFSTHKASIINSLGHEEPIQEVMAGLSQTCNAQVSGA
jgi:hypothetical protein